MEEREREKRETADREFLWKELHRRAAAQVRVRQPEKPQENRPQQDRPQRSAAKSVSSSVDEKEDLAVQRAFAKVRELEKAGLYRPRYKTTEEQRNCWNCGSPTHHYNRCPVKIKLFCQRCGAKGMTSENCPRCGPQGYRARQSSYSLQYE